MSLIKDFARFVKTRPCGSAATLSLEDEDRIDAGIRVVLTPPDGPFEGAKVELVLSFSDYPESAPKVNCLTDLYHPNIESPEVDCGDICLNILEEDFDSCLRLEDYVQALLFLLYEPNVEDPLTELDSDDNYDLESYLDNVRLAIRGEFTNDSNDHTYACILANPGAAAASTAAAATATTDTATGPFLPLMVTTPTAGPVFHILRTEQPQPQGGVAVVPADNATTTPSPTAAAATAQPTTAGRTSLRKSTDSLRISGGASQPARTSPAIAALTARFLQAAAAHA